MFPQTFDNIAVQYWIIFPNYFLECAIVKSLRKVSRISLVKQKRSNIKMTFNSFRFSNISIPAGCKEFHINSKPRNHYNLLVFGI